MWTEVQNKTFHRDVVNTSQVEKADSVHTSQDLNAFLQKNVSTSAGLGQSCSEDQISRGNGIIPGAIAAAVFISFLLSLYAVLWKCMVSPPQRKKRKVRTREQRERTPV